MKILLKLFSVGMLSTLFISNGFSLTCPPSDMDTQICQYSNSMNTILIVGSGLSSMTIADTTNACCRYDCDASKNAIFHNNNCACNTDYYLDGNSCTKCRTDDGYHTDGPGAANKALCKKTCPLITVTNGIGGNPVSEKITENDLNGCDYDIECNTGYGSSGRYHDITEYTCTANNYTVSYNCGTGSSGSTANSEHIYDMAKNLTLNGCTRSDGRIFKGWDNNSNATNVEYADEASVTNLTNIQNGTVTLYAVWGDCPNSKNAVELTPDSCTITKCDSGYKLDGTGNSTTCTECVPPGSYCTDGVHELPCEKGWYCANVRTRTPCPPGKTSPESSDEIKDCHYVTVSEAGGDSANATQFCDGSGNNCFTLP